MRNSFLTCMLIHTGRKQKIRFPQGTFHPAKAQVPRSNSLLLSQEMSLYLITHHPGGEGDPE